MESIFCEVAVFYKPDISIKLRFSEVRKYMEYVPLNDHGARIGGQFQETSLGRVQKIHE